MMKTRVFAAVRELRGLSQAELAARIGRSQQWLSLLESGKVDPKDRDIKRIAMVLGLNVELLRSWTMEVTVQDVEEDIFRYV